MNFGDRNPFGTSDWADIRVAVPASVNKYRDNYDYFERGLRSDVPFYYKPLEIIGRGAIATSGALVKTLLDPLPRSTREYANNKTRVDFDMSQSKRRPRTQKPKKKTPPPARGRGRGRGRGGRPVRYFRRPGPFMINNRAYSTPKTAGMFKAEKAFPAVSYAQNAQAGPLVKFTTGRAPGCMRMKVHFRLGQVGVQSFTKLGGGTVVQPCFMSMGDGTHYDPVLPINPSMTFYFPPYIANMCLCFQQFYVNHVSLTLKPRVNTLNQAVVTLGYCQDVLWPESIGAVSNTFQGLPTESQIGSLTSSCTDVLYRDCTIAAAQVDKKTKFYMANDFSGAATPIIYSTPNADLRLAFAGAFVVAGVINGTDANGTIYADLYMNIDVELCGFNTFINTSLYPLSDNKKKQHDSLEDEVLVPRVSRRTETKSSSLK